MTTNESEFQKEKDHYGIRSLEEDIFDPIFETATERCCVHLDLLEKSLAGNPQLASALTSASSSSSSSTSSASETVKQSIDALLQQVLQKSFNKNFDRFEIFVLQHILHFPQALKLPSDSFSPSSSSSSSSSSSANLQRLRQENQALDEEIRNLSLDIQGFSSLNETLRQHSRELGQRQEAYSLYTQNLLGLSEITKGSESHFQELVSKYKETQNLVKTVAMLSRTSGITSHKEDQKGAEELFAQHMETISVPTGILSQLANNATI